MVNRNLSVWGGRPWLKTELRAEVCEIASELEDLGYTRLWITGGQREGVSSVFGDVLDTTGTIGVASGILSIWKATPGQAAAAATDLQQRHPGRFLLGLGNSHAPAVEPSGQQYVRPYSRTVEYLDALDEPSTYVPVENRALAALGPRMLQLAANRSLGAHPYFAPVEHTAICRDELGSGALLAPEVAVVLEPDAITARAIARRYMATYLALPNYTKNLRRLGYGDDDLGAGGSDRLVDALIPWGDLDSVARGLTAHFDAGADEIAVQVLPANPKSLPRREFAELAAALIG